MNTPVPAVLAQADKRDLRTYFVSFIQESMLIRVYLWLKNSFQTVS
jgi:hypothetical protein